MAVGETAAEETAPKNTAVENTAVENTAVENTAAEWPFTPPARPEVPAVRRGDWVTNAIDAFVLEKLEAAGLAPGDPADRLTLLRRVTFDLTGLPPTVEEQQAFLSDTSPEAYQRVVDRLLASPRYGERWAQHWLDLVRYAETNGFKADELRPLAHKYRDYVIQALNDDLPYDRFIRQQLAGDELEPDNPQALVATGLNRLYPDESNAANLEQRRQEILDDITETTGLVFMGLTMGCAQCHDHKFDDILQEDYFRLQAFFAPMIPRDDVAAATPAEVAEHERKRSEWEAATAGVRAEIDALLAEKRGSARKYALTKFRQEIQDAVDLPESQRTPYQQQITLMALRQADAKADDVAEKLSDEGKQRYEDLKKQLAEFDHLKPEPLPAAMAVTDMGDVSPPTYVLATGNWRDPLEEVDPGFPHFLSRDTPDTSVDNPLVASTGRRAALARWLASREHPLTARVMVNRLWQHHFGQGIVPTPNDFGVQGEAATHPELLDWLAVEFVEQGFSLKAMHRLMVTSSTYRQSSRFEPTDPAHAKAVQIDGQNRLLWRARRQRLGGEAIRDAMLAVTGELNTRMFGPSARPRLPEGISKSYRWEEDNEVASRHRRSIYVFAKRNMRYPLFEAFDQPDLHHSCAVRSLTTTAPQALLLLNGEFSFQRARHFAGRVLAAAGDQDEMIQTAYRLAWGRPATEDEIATAKDFLKQQRASFTSEVDESAYPLPAADGVPPELATATVDFCHALLNANEFLFID